jgi:hypothetical protein
MFYPSHSRHAKQLLWWTLAPTFHLLLYRSRRMEARDFLSLQLREMWSIVPQIGIGTMFYIIVFASDFSKNRFPLFGPMV